MAPDSINKTQLAGGENICHRKSPLLLPTTLGQFKLVDQLCLREKCTLWDPELQQCRDVSNSKWLIEIAKSLDKLVELTGTLCFHAGEK